MMSTTVTRKGQVTIPKAVRDSLGIKAHDRVTFFVRNKEVIMRPSRGTILDLRGSVSPRAVPEDFGRIRSHVKKERNKRFSRVLNND